MYKYKHVLHVFISIMVMVVDRNTQDLHGGIPVYMLVIHTTSSTLEYFET